MFCAKDRLDAIDNTLRIELRKKDREIESLQHQLKDALIWARKWRQKAKHLRTVRRDLIEKTDFSRKASCVKTRVEYKPRPSTSNSNSN